MARPLRIEFPGAIYHITSRGYRLESIYDDDEDRMRFLPITGEALTRAGAHVLAYCLWADHYHRVVETAAAGLWTLMRHINGTYPRLTTPGTAGRTRVPRPLQSRMSQLISRANKQVTSRGAGRWKTGPAIAT